MTSHSETTSVKFNEIVINEVEEKSTNEVER